MKKRIKTLLVLVLFFFLSSFSSQDAFAAFPDLQICTNENGFLFFGSPVQRKIRIAESTGIVFKEINIPADISQNSRFQVCPCGGFVVIYDALQKKLFYMNDQTEEIEESFPVTGTVSDIAVSKNRSRYVGIAKGSAKTITLFDEARQFIRDLSLAATIQEATLIQLDRENKLWVYDKKSASLFQFDTKGSLLLTVSKFGLNAIPELVSIDSDNYNMLYVMDKNGTTYSVNSRGENINKTAWNKSGSKTMAYDAINKYTYIASQSIFCGDSSKQKKWEIASPWQLPVKKILEMRIGSRMFTQYGYRPVTMDAAPYIDVFSKRTMVPLRNIAEAVGCEVKWTSQTQKIELSKSGLTVTLTINQNYAVVNGRKIPLDAPPVIKNNRTFIPLRFVGETFAFQVIWKEIEKIIRLIS